MESDVEESQRKRQTKYSFPGDSSREHFELLAGRPLASMGGVNFMQDDDFRLGTTRARFASLLKRHGDLTERFSSKITVSLRYADLVSVLLTRIRVLAWPMQQFKKSTLGPTTLNRKEDGSSPAPVCLTYA